MHGGVQGVGFRYTARLQADRFGVAGWVRNRADGTVEAEVEGDEASVQAMLDWLAEGPPGAAVRTHRRLGGRAQRRAGLPHRVLSGCRVRRRLGPRHSTGASSSPPTTIDVGPSKPCSKTVANDRVAVVPAGSR